MRWGPLGAHGSIGGRRPLGALGPAGGPAPCRCGATRGPPPCVGMGGGGGAQAKAPRARVGARWHGGAHCFVLRKEAASVWETGGRGPRAELPEREVIPLLTERVSNAQQAGADPNVNIAHFAKFLWSLWISPASSPRFS